MSLWFVLAQVLAFWSVWRGYVERMLRSGGDAYALVALATALALLWSYRPKRPGVHGAGRMIVAAMMLIYGLLYPYLPFELRAAAALLILAVSLSFAMGEPVPHPGLIGLFWLSLPLIPSLQFYLGHPMRILVARLTVGFLRLGGLWVTREGSVLIWLDRFVSIDAPCSGVHMLWTAGYLVCSLSLIFRLSAARTVWCGALTLTAVFLANALRSAALFHLETGRIVLPDAAHDGVGMAAFAILAATVFLLVYREHRRQQSRTRPARQEPASSGNGRHRPGSGGTSGWCIPVAACLFAALVPLLARTPSDRPMSRRDFPGWPQTWEGRSLTSLPLTERERHFAAGFPGHIGRFTDGTSEIIIRWVTEPTRRLHPAVDCLRAQGDQVTALPLYVDERGRFWGSLEVRRQNDRFLAREILVDAEGSSWSDVSSWFWAAALGRSPGPWWNYVVMQRHSQANQSWRDSNSQ